MSDTQYDENAKARHAKHEEAAKKFMTEVDVALLRGLRDTALFSQREELLHALRALLRDEYGFGYRRGQRDLKERLQELLK